MGLIKISVIIPYKNSLDTLPRLVRSIPNRDDVEVIIIDNSEIPLQLSQFDPHRPVTLAYSSPERYAGGARNVGLDIALGEWLIFADADDFFTKDAFETFISFVDSSYDLIYFKAQGVYDDTLEPNDRGDEWSRIIDNYEMGLINEMEARLKYVVPWGKMIKRHVVQTNKIYFDEVLAANDVMFSTLCAYYSRNFYAVNRVVYNVTVRKGSLANRRDLDVVRSRYMVALRRNQFLRDSHLSCYQGSVMYYIFNSRSFGIKILWEFLRQAIHYRQNIFIGWKNWINTFIYSKKRDKRNNKYITR